MILDGRGSFGARPLKKNNRSIIVATLLVAILVACTAVPATPTSIPTPPPAESGWWNDAVFYEIFVRSFSDTDADGNGDLRGLLARLDYLNDGDPATDNDLGVTALWLMPIMQSPSYHGYDVVDYFTVEEDYGTAEDLRALVDAAHQRGMHVIVDLVLNHTSSAHPWFVEAASAPEAAYRDWYVWVDEAPAFLGPQGQRVWHPLGEDYYYGLFWDQMPDLNYRNPAVTEEMQRAARFWLEEMGVDGFRLDAVRHLIEEGSQQYDTPATHAWLVQFDQFTDEVDAEVLTVGEVWADTRHAAPYVVDDEVDLVFEFDLAGAVVDAVGDGDPDWLAYVMEGVDASYPRGQYATFLTNHDQDRAMSEFGGDPQKARLAATLLLTLPGVPFIYYGEEIGMLGQKPDELIRTPMQWSDGENGGFSTGQPWEPLNVDYPLVNVAAQSDDPYSLLSHYRQLIRLRSDHVALRRGAFLPLASDCAPLYVFLRWHEQEAVLVVVNLAAGAQANCALSLAASELAPGSYGVRELLSGAAAAPLTVDGDGAFGGYVPLAALEPRGAAILALEEAR